MKITATMVLRILRPERVVLDVSVDKIVAEGPDGFFGLLPRHIDIVVPLVSGILFFTQGGAETAVAVDEGVLVKCGAEVLVSVHDAVVGPDLASLATTVRARFEERRRQETALHTALAKLETDIVRRFSDLR